MNQKEKILKQSLAIRTFPILQVEAICDNFNYDDYTEVKPFESIITECAVMTHANMLPEDRKKVGISDGFIRISCGICGAELG